MEVTGFASNIFSSPRAIPPLNGCSVGQEAWKSSRRGGCRGICQGQWGGRAVRVARALAGLSQLSASSFLLLVILLL